MDKYIPILSLDAKTKIPSKPASIRFVKHDHRVWAVATHENRDYATLGVRTYRAARCAAMQFGVLFLVLRWTEPHRLTSSEFDLLVK